MSRRLKVDKIGKSSKFCLYRLCPKPSLKNVIVILLPLGTLITRMAKQLSNICVVKINILLRYNGKFAFVFCCISACSGVMWKFD